MVFTLEHGYPDKKPRSTASDLGVYCLSTSHKKDARKELVTSLFLPFDGM